MSTAAQLAYVLADASVSYVGASVQTDFVLAASQLAYVDAVASQVRLDPFLIYFSFEDQVALADAIAFTYGRVLADSVLIEEDLIVSFTKILSDAFVMDDMTGIDSFVLDTIASKTNIAVVTDVAAIHLSRPVTDTIGFAELVNLVWGREVLDIATVSDMLVLDLFYVPSAIINGGELNTFELNE